MRADNKNTSMELVLRTRDTSGRVPLVRPGRVGLAVGRTDALDALPELAFALTERDLTCATDRAARFKP